MKTSVIITCHNYGKYLKESIDSVINQTTSSKEIIVINDASDDETEEIALSFGNKISYYFVDFKNAQKSRNFGLKKSKGEYVIFLDADDYFRNDLLEKMQSEMDNDHELVLIYSDRENFGNDTILKNLGIENSWKTLDYDYEKLIFGNYISLPSLIRRENFIGFDEEINRFQDWEAWITLLKNGKAKRIPEPLFFVRFHGDNKTIKTDGDIERIKILSKHKRFDILSNDICEMKSIITQKEQEIQQKEQEIQQKEQEIQQKEQELAFIKSSKFWKLREFYIKLKKYGK